MGEIKEPTAKRQLEIYQDSFYKFVGHGYGKRGEDTPSLFAFNKTANMWIRISKVSTRDAVLGRSPDFPEVMIQVGWDHSRLRSQDYVDFPLITGCVLLPDKIAYDGDKQLYQLYIGSQYGKYSHPTIFYLPKRDLDAYFKK